MNLAHMHLILNHIPVIGIPVALAFLVYGIYVKSHLLQRFALLILIALAGSVLPVYFTGEPAEEVVEHLPGVEEPFIEAHEDAAMFSLVLTLITGVVALINIYFYKDSKKTRFLNFSVLAVAIAAAISLLYTANKGGRIRHAELRPSSSYSIGTEVSSEKASD